MKLYDLHVHSCYSHDVKEKGNTGIDALCKRALETGLSGIAFSDHFDADHQYAGIHLLDNEGVRRDVMAAKEKYPELCVICSVEIAQQMYYQGFCCDLMKKYDYDMIISSDHILEADSDKVTSLMHFDEYEDATVRGFFETYLRELTYTAKHCDFDVLAHLTYPLRYLKRYGKDHVAPIEKDLDAYDEIMKTIIHRGIAFEVNTSGLRQGHGETFPNDLLIKRYLAFGGELITVGSDSHTWEDIGADVKTVTEKLASLGVKATCFYQKRKPQLVSIR